LIEWRHGQRAAMASSWRCVFGFLFLRPKEASEAHVVVRHPLGFLLILILIEIDEMRTKRATRPRPRNNLVFVVLFLLARPYCLRLSCRLRRLVYTSHGPRVGYSCRLFLYLEDCFVTPSLFSHRSSFVINLTEIY
jgi:hypothetical protein